MDHKGEYDKKILELQDQITAETIKRDGEDRKRCYHKITRFLQNDVWKIALLKEAICYWGRRTFHLLPLQDETACQLYKVNHTEFGFGFEILSCKRVFR